MPNPTVTGPKALIIKTNEIPAGGLEFHFTSQSKELDGALSDLLDEHPLYDIELSVKAIDEIVQLKGIFSATVHHACSRCAEEFTKTYSGKFTTLFQKPNDKLKSLGEVFISPESETLSESFEIDFLTTNELNLGDAVHEQLALEFSFQPLCSEDCLGLCAQCGSNLNLDPCHCSGPLEIKKSSPFEKLKNLYESI